MSFRKEAPLSETGKTENLRSGSPGNRPLDPFDRKILGELTRDAGTGYVELGQKVGLSAPAVHERVKKLRASGCLRGTAALLDGPAIGKHLLAFVHIDSVGWGGTEDLMALSQFPEVEEIHSVAGDTSMMVKMRCASTRALEALLARLHESRGVRSTSTYIVLSTYLERPVQADITPTMEAKLVPSR